MKKPLAWKWNDPVEGARWIFDLEDMEEIKRQDSGLIVPVKAGFCVECGIIVIDYNIDTIGRGYRTAKYNQFTGECFCQDCFVAEGDN